MNPIETKENISKIGDTSESVYKSIHDNEFLFDFIESQPNSVKDALFTKYKNVEGPILGIRRDLAVGLESGNVDRKAIIEKFETGKKETPRRFTQYKNVFAVLYPFCVNGTIDLVYETLENLANDIRESLDIVPDTKTKVFGFDGPRNTGSDHAWFAIFNKSYPNQSLAKQLFFSIQNGQITYALYDRAKDFFIDKSVSKTSDIDLPTMLSFFEKHKDAIRNDVCNEKKGASLSWEKLISDLQNNKIGAWLVKPGIKGAMWKQALEEENIRIGWGYVFEDMYQENRFDDAFILDRLSYHYESHAKNQHNNKNSIRSFATEIKSGDLIFAVSGKSDIIGVGVVNEEIALDEGNEEYKAFVTVSWLKDLYKSPYKPNKPMPIKTVTKLANNEAIDHVKQIFEGQSSVNQTEMMDLPFGLNTILYGPPGTGKTFELTRIKREYFTNYENEDEETVSLSETATSYPLWKILAAIIGIANKPLAVTEIVQHPLILARAKPSNKTKPNTAVWADLQSYADDESTQLADKYRMAIKLFHKEQDSKWTIAQDKVAELANIVGQELIDIASNPHNKSASIRPSVFKRYEFITFHQKYSYEDFIEGIKPMLSQDAGEIVSNDLQFELKRGIFYRSCLSALNLAGYKSFKECYEDSFSNRRAQFEAIQTNTKKQFAILIDEINRANISAVFGELITLLEEDKRIGQKDINDNPSEIWVKLPVSNEPFCVPPNLYVIGSMNTADRSIALLDIALRRRFDFVALYPKYSDDWWAPLLKSLNEAIYNVKQNPDFFIGHAFFINKDETEKLDILNKKIIPLLYEYFQNNVNKVKATLTEAKISFTQPALENNYQIHAI